MSVQDVTVHSFSGKTKHKKNTATIYINLVVNEAFVFMLENTFIQADCSSLSSTG